MSDSECIQLGDVTAASLLSEDVCKEIDAVMNADRQEITRDGSSVIYTYIFLQPCLYQQLSTCVSSWKNTFKFKLKLIKLKLIEIQNVAITLNFGYFFKQLKNGKNGKSR